MKNDILLKYRMLNAEEVNREIFKDFIRYSAYNFRFVQPNLIHSQTLLSRAFGLFLWKGRMNAMGRRDQSAGHPDFR